MTLVNGNIYEVMQKAAPKNIQQPNHPLEIQAFIVEIMLFI